MQCSRRHGRRRCNAHVSVVVRPREQPAGPQPECVFVELTPCRPNRKCPADPPGVDGEAGCRSLVQQQPQGRLGIGMLSNAI